MSTYKVKAKDTHSNLIVETLEAENQKEVIDAMHRRGLTVLNIEELYTKGKRSKKKIKSDELVIFTRQIATLVNSGIPLIDGLKTLCEQSEHYTFRQVITGIISLIEGGNSFTEAVGKYPRVFGTFYINMVKAGEASGELSEILIRVADYLEHINSLKRKIRMAMVYPIMVSAMAGVITLLLFFKVIPVFEGIYKDFGAQLPLPTLILVALSKWLRRWFILFIAIIIICSFLFMRFKNTEKGRWLYDRFKFRVPVFGNLFKKVAISKFSKTLGTLIKSGVPILSSLEIVKEISGNKLVEKSILKAADRIREGKSIEEPLRQSGVFPPMVTKMIGVGEKSGRLEEMLEKVSVYYDEQVTAVINGMTSLIEPLLIAFLGIVVGGIVICMFLPVFKLAVVDSA